MDVPRISPVGVPEFPPSYSASRRHIPLPLRILAAALALVFAFVVVTTTVVSVGSYCLTSDGGDTRMLPPPAAGAPHEAGSERTGPGAATP